MHSANRRNGPTPATLVTQNRWHIDHADFLRTAFARYGDIALYRQATGLLIHAVMLPAMTTAGKAELNKRLLETSLTKISNRVFGHTQPM